jgi:hypothetical protein
MIKIQRHVLAGVAIQPAVIAFAAVKKNLVVTHSEYFCSRLFIVIYPDLNACWLLQVNTV